MNEPQIPVKYIFRRPRWVDNIYGSGLEFTTGQTRIVPESLALKFLRHTDTFVLDEETQAPIKTIEQETDEALAAAQRSADERAKRDDQLYESYLLIDQMGKEPLAQYVRDRFALALDETADIDAMRVEAKALIDRFGLV